LTDLKKKNLNVLDNF